jgi:hypothetical protein
VSHGSAGFVPQFLATSDSDLIGGLVRTTSDAGFESQSSPQVRVWQEQMSCLKRTLSTPGFEDWFLVLEFELPRRGRRPDVILLDGHSIFIVEFKHSTDRLDAAARWQVGTYALDLRDFHAGSQGRRIVPVLCSSEDVDCAAPHVPEIGSEPVLPVLSATAQNLAELLLKVSRALKGPGQAPRDPWQWLQAPYRPTPGIIEAALRLYEGHEIRDLSHRHAANLKETTEWLLEEIETARRCKRHVVCFVTGIPGAGKTLTGLNVVHTRALQEKAGTGAVFLSGNGPLVKVMQEALVRQCVERGGLRPECERQVKTFIQNVHQFIRYYTEHSAELPAEHVVVFDEAQRAWNQEQMLRKFRRTASEPSMLTDIMERFSDGAVMIALIGGGQEIYLGEAGLEEWGRALAARPGRWQIVASPDALAGGESVAGHRLFTAQPPSGVVVREEPRAHLSVNFRTVHAERWNAWVNAFLEGRGEHAREHFPNAQEFPCWLTRDLNEARRWLQTMAELDPGSRIGLVVGSEDERVRAYGIEVSSGFRHGYPYPRWFLDSKEDVRSSYRLEVAASEFECQGLELDWVGLCWGADLLPGDEGWVYRRFRGTAWQAVRTPAEQMYVLNRYRVLLTRARKGMVIWVPAGLPDDSTHQPAWFDRLQRALEAAGVPTKDPILVSV